MNAKVAIREVIELGHMVVNAYIDDLTDAELLVRSVPGTNHIAWQLGHLICSDAEMLRAIGRTPAMLPPGFAESYTKETSTSDDPKKFLGKDQYRDLIGKSKAAALAALEATPDAELDRPGPEAMRAYAPTVAAVLSLAGTHWLMHTGQFVPIRRKLGRKPLF